MNDNVIDGRERAAAIRADVTERATRFAEAHGRPPTLVAVLAGDDPASVSYAKSKGRAAERAGLEYRLHHMGGSASTDDLCAAVRALTDDAGVDGILVEMPLPAGCDADAVNATIDPARDVDGVTPASWLKLLTGRPGPRPATALAVMDLIEYSGTPLEGARAVVIGRSMVVGKPTLLMLIAAHATVTVTHSRTRDLDKVASEADVLVAAAGQAGLVTAAFVKPGATVIDVGTNMVGDGEGQRMVGDVDYAAAAAIAGAITPVPGGVGPVTTALALRSTVDLAEARMGPAG